MEAYKVLKKLGFIKKGDYNYGYYTKVLKRGKDKFRYRINWHPDDPKVFYIYKITKKGEEIIDEDEFLKGKREESIAAVTQYKYILEQIKKASVVQIQKP
ncbi:hypothetical protein [Peptoniphilus catoniae]|uniref:hypothetical protein n=1 Tax=Peptoniphilus catoniae TaxID=1660341 RepID=UPI0010FDAE98|nr:hypothetical protein [Peptoniphilus catoniae]